MSTDKNCLFCDTKCDVDQTPNHHLLNTYRCKYCGEYILPQKGLSAIYSIQEPTDKFKIACILNERRLKGQVGIALGDKTDEKNEVCNFPLVSIDNILNEFPKKASDFLNRTLLNLSRLTDRPFDVIKLNMATEGNRLHLFTSEIQNCYAFYVSWLGRDSSDLMK